jgi:hypothetical protein
MILVAGLAGLLATAAGATGACACPCPPAAPLFPLPEAEAFALNRKGRELYRQRRFAEARAAYGEALARDPAFVAPRLNIACAFTQEERFADAVTEAAALAEARYVPWGREITEAADLAPLRIRPEARALQAALAKAAAGWGSAIASRADALLILARTAPPVRLPAEGAGAFVLALAQEIFAYEPARGAYRQVTAEDGHVLAFVRSRDGRALIYLGGGKVVRASGEVDRLRGLFVRRLDLPTMTLGPRVALPGDLVEVGLRFTEQASLRLTTHESGRPRETRELLFDGTALVTVPAAANASAARLGAPAVTLGANGVVPRGIEAAAGSCAFTARDAPAGTPATVLIRAAGGRRFVLTAPEGAALSGLPFPTVPRGR